MHRYRNLAAAVLTVAVLGFSHAQGIERRTESYQSPAGALPLAAPSAQPGNSPIAIAIARPAPTFDVKTSDRSVREALARWARSAGWVHEPIHWTLDKDHPVEGVAGPEVFGEDFRTAVRKLLASTELTDRPVQPCFYANSVVRVIPRSAFCDRTVE